MRKDEYARIARLSDTHFWYVGSQDFLRLAITRYKNSDNLKILDAGCGPGAMYEALKQFGTVYGIDESDQALFFCKKKGFLAKKGGIEKIPFPDKLFDVVVCTEVLYHKGVKDPQKAISELFRVLKPNGIVISREPAFPFLYRTHDKVVHTGRRFYLKNYRNLFKLNGFNTLKCGYSNFLTFFLIISKLLINKLNKENIESDVTISSYIINFLLKKIFYLENRIIFLIKLPIGSSVYFIGRK